MSDEPSTSRPLPWWKPVLLIVAVAVLFTLAVVLDWDQKLQQARDWIESLGPWAPVAFITLYIGGTVAAIPGSALTLIAGALFGGWLGTLYVSIAATIGAAICFLISRYFARDAVGAWMERRPSFRRLDDLTEQYGGWMVAATRLAPFFPYNLLNYGFGLTRVKFWTYVWVSWLCMLPGTAAYVFFSDALVTWWSTGRAPWVLLGVAGVTLVIVLLVGWWARRRFVAAQENQP